MILQSIASDKVAVAYVTAGVTSPLWLPTLDAASRTAGLFVPILAVLLFALKIYVEWAKRPRDPSAPASWSWLKKPLVIAGAAIVALVTLSFLMRADAQAAPAPQERPRVAARRRRTADDAGEDETVSGDTTGAALTEAGAPAYAGIALQDTGMSETLPNGKFNPDVQAMFALLTNPADFGAKKRPDGSWDTSKVNTKRIPWCSVGLNAWVVRSGMPGTGDAAARSWLKWGDAVPAGKHRKWDVIVIWRGEHNDGWSGHVGVLDGETPTHWRIRGCNQGDAVSVALFPKQRYDKKRREWVPVLLGFRRPRSVWASRVTRASVAGVLTSGTAAAGGTAAIVADATATPTPPPAPPVDLSALEQVPEALNKAAEPLQQIGTPSAVKFATMLMVIAGLLTFGLFVYTILRKREDHALTGR